MIFAVLLDATTFPALATSKPTTPSAVLLRALRVLALLATPTSMPLARTAATAATSSPRP